MFVPTTLVDTEGALTNYSNAGALNFENLKLNAAAYLNTTLTADSFTITTSKTEEASLTPAWYTDDTTYGYDADTTQPTAYDDERHFNGPKLATDKADAIAKELYTESVTGDDPYQYTKTWKDYYYGMATIQDVASFNYDIVEEEIATTGKVQVTGSLKLDYTDAFTAEEANVVLGGYAGEVVIDGTKSNLVNLFVMGLSAYRDTNDATPYAWESEPLLNVTMYADNKRSDLLNINGDAILKSLASDADVYVGGALETTDDVNLTFNDKERNLVAVGDVTAGGNFYAKNAEIGGALTATAVKMTDNLTVTSALTATGYISTIVSEVETKTAIAADAITATTIVITGGGDLRSGDDITATTGAITVADEGSIIANGNVTAADKIEAKDITTTGAVEASGDGIAATGNIAANGGLLANTGDIVAANSIKASIGGIEATSGSIEATSGSIAALSDIIASTGITAFEGISTVASGIMTTTGDITATSGGITAIKDIVATSGAITAGGVISGTQNIVAGTNITAGDSIIADGGNVSAGGKVTAQTDVKAEGGNILVTSALVASAGEIKAKTAVSAASITAQTDLTVTNGTITATTGNITTVEGAIDAKGNIQAADGIAAKTTIKTKNNITATAGDIRAEGAAALREADETLYGIAATGVIFATSGNIKADTGAIYAGAGIAANGADKSITAGGKITAGAGNIVADQDITAAGEVSAEAGSISATSGTLTAYSSSGETETWYMATAKDDITAKTIETGGITVTNGTVHADSINVHEGDILVGTFIDQEGSTQDRKSELEVSHVANVSAGQYIEAKSLTGNGSGNLAAGQYIYALDSAGSRGDITGFKRIDITSGTLFANDVNVTGGILIAGGDPGEAYTKGTIDVSNLTAGGDVITKADQIKVSGGVNVTSGILMAAKGVDIDGDVVAADAIYVKTGDIDLATVTTVAGHTWTDAEVAAGTAPARAGKTDALVADAGSITATGEVGTLGGNVIANVNVDFQDNVETISGNVVATTGNVTFGGTLGTAGDVTARGVRCSAAQSRASVMSRRRLARLSSAARWAKAAM